MAASVNCVGVLGGHCKNYLRLSFLFNNSYSSGANIYRKNVEKIDKVRDCSGLSHKWKKRLRGEKPDKQKIELLYEHERRAKLRHYFAVHGLSSGIHPNILYPSKDELKNLQEIETEWTSSFQQLKENLESKIATEAEEARLRDEKIERAMGKMDQLIAQYKQKQKKVQEADQLQDEKTQQYLEEFRERYGFNVPVTSGKFRMFKLLKMEENKELKRKLKKESKKEQSMKNLESILSKQAETKS